MNIDNLIAFNGKTIQTKKLHEVGYTNTDINKLLDEGKLERVRRGYYKVNLDFKSDIKTMKYYLLNNYYSDFKEYFDNLPIKDYDAYYYSFLCNILISDYREAYSSLVKCCELNTEDCNKNNLYAYTLLLNELLSLPEDKLSYLKEKIFDKKYYMDIFIESLVNRNYDQACEQLKDIKQNNGLNKIELDVLRNMSFKVNNIHKKDNVKNKDNEYNKLFSSMHIQIVNNNFEQGYYTFNKLLYLKDSLNISDERLDIIKDLFLCFNFIVENQDIDLNTYKTNYKYGKNIYNNFNLAIRKNDYIKALELCRKIVLKTPSEEYEIYNTLLERIYNFLNIRTIIKNQARNRNPFMSMIHDKNYNDALKIAKKTNMDEHDKNIVTNLLESLVYVDNITIEG